jgi:FAD/FMN-containing dehydrogenase
MPGSRREIWWTWFVGAEGTLGLVTGAEWRLVPVPTRYAGIRASLVDIKSIGAIVPQLLEIDPSAVEYLDASFLRFVGQAEDGVAGLLMVELEGDESDSLTERLREARHILRPHSVTLDEAADRAGSRESLGHSSRREPHSGATGRRATLDAGDRGWLCAGGGAGPLYRRGARRRRAPWDRAGDLRPCR